MPRSGEVDAASRAARDELIGSVVTVVGSGHPPFVGTTGRVVDETAHTFVVETEDGREVVVPKRGQRFAFELASGRVELDGETLAHHPVDRIKKNR